MLFCVSFCTFHFLIHCLTIVNKDGKIGAVGFVSVINPEVYPVSLIKVDEYTREPIRRKDGLCTRCQPGK